MAGIGFELKKVFKEGSITSRAVGYSCAGIVIAGPTVMIILMLLILERMARASGNGDWDILLSFMIYAMIGALLVSSILGQVLARWSADALFRKDYDRVMPSAYGAFLVLIIPFGILYALLASTAEVSLVDKVLNWMDWCIMTMVYIYMGYLTAIKKYVSVVIWFLCGVVTVVLLSFLFVSVIGLGIITGVQLAIFIGYGVLMMGYSYGLHVEFPFGKGSLLAFAEYMEKYWELMVCGFLGIAMSFVHIVIMWFAGKYGRQVTGLYYSAPVYDVATFYAFLCAIPTNILFVVSMETKFYEKFHDFYTLISTNGTLAEIRLARYGMIRALRNEITRLELVQLMVMMLYMVFMRFYLSTIGFTQTLLVMFFFLCVGYAAQGIGASFTLLLLYFDDRKGAVITNLTGFLVTAIVTWVFRNNTDLYGIGMATGGLAMFVTGMIRLDYYVRDIDNHTFSSQPIFMVVSESAFLKYIRKLDKRAIMKQRMYEKRRDREDYEEVLAKARKKRDRGIKNEE